jgi:hypothetical protein
VIFLAHNINPVLQILFNQASKKRKATSQTVDDTPEGIPPPPPKNLAASCSVTDETDTAIDDTFSLHPDDPINFLKLSTALRLLIKCRLSVEDIKLADELLREYGTELIKVRLMLSSLPF